MAKCLTWPIRTVAFVAIASFPSISQGRPVAISHDEPAATAVANVEAWIAVHPRDAEGYRALGRIHALAWANGDTIPLVGPGGPGTLPFFSERSTVLVLRFGPGEMRLHNNQMDAEDRKERPVSASDASHLAASITAYNKAISLDANDALSELGLGWMLEQQGRYARQLPADFFAVSPAPDAQKGAWQAAVAQLADANPAVRDAATKALLSAMPQSIGVMVEAKTDNAEAGARIGGILRDYFEVQALDHYRKAFELRRAADLAGQPTFEIDSPLSARAGTEILAVLARHPEAAGKDEARAVQAVLDPLDKKKQALLMGPQ